MANDDADDDHDENRKLLFESMNTMCEMQRSRIAININLGSVNIYNINTRKTQIRNGLTKQNDERVEKKIKRLNTVAGNMISDASLLVNCKYTTSDEPQQDELIL